MGHQKIKNIILPFLFLSFAVGYGQIEYPDSFIKLLDFEYDDIINNNVKNIPDGRYYKTKYSNENVLMEIEVTGYKNQKKHGESLTFLKGLESMFIAKVVNYKNDVMNGYYFESDNHTYSKEGYYKNGKKQGVWKIKEAGNVMEVTFKNNLKSGLFKSNDKTLNIKEFGKHKKDKKEGVWLIEDTSIGQVTKEVYKDGVLIK
ncbi:hypothetical protein [Aquimarina muelleri]|uniref:MORN repeat variant n=1 Tax=Aquimarina muelleri TaxID=279356 RepID=A0A918JU88_9FLAO|nr:hypothetical protein [Aquimarina muelleri]MCX2761711.1 hypothetical protein [Aquimarina muelleri]GGX15604.1 hypothetical protein GCM10007384_16420 [Aquimarina muelleri]